MADFFFDYGLFALKTLTIAVLLAIAVALLTGLIGGAVHRQASTDPERLEIIKVNDRIQRERETIEHALLDHEAHVLAIKRKKGQLKRERKERKKALKAKPARQEPPPAEPEARRRVYVVDFEGDLQATAVGSLRRSLSAILAVVREQDEVVVRLESSGGLVHSYGLAASQLQRVVDKKIKLTICVDKVAASGGYMMACVADQLLAAPFAVLGSIGVVAQLPNFHRLLKKNDVDFELLTAGDYKRTLTVFGENTEQGREKFRRDLEDTHALFKEFVHEQRPDLDLEEVATGEIWFGRRALEKKLVDRLQTSDEYLGAACEEADVLEIRYVHKKSIREKVVSAVEMGVAQSIGRWWRRATERNLG